VIISYLFLLFLLKKQHSPQDLRVVCGLKELKNASNACKCFARALKIGEKGLRQIDYA